MGVKGLSLFTEPARSQNLNRTVWVTTDIGGTDPDDIQSLIHLFQYSNILRIAGVTTGPLGGDLAAAMAVKQRYRNDYQNFGWEEKGMQAPSSIKLFQGKRNASDFSNTAEVQALVNESRKDIYSPENPLIILQWGASTDVAAAIRNGLRRNNCFLYAVVGFSPNDFNARQDREAFEIVRNTNNLRRIFADGTIRGMYTGWDLTANRRYVENQIRPRGRMGRYFFNISEQINTGSFSIKMGDSPSVAWALSSENLSPRRPSWGGRFRSIGNRFWTARRNTSLGGHAGANTVDRRAITRDWRMQLEFLYG